MLSKLFNVLGAVDGLVFVHASLISKVLMVAVKKVFRSLRKFRPKLVADGVFIRATTSQARRAFMVGG